MTFRPERPLDYLHVHKLTPAEQKLLEEYAKEPSLAAIARKLNVSTNCIQMRGKSIREKLQVETLKEALAHWLPEQGSNL